MESTNEINNSLQPVCNVCPTCNTTRIHKTKDTKYKCYQCQNIFQNPNTRPSNRQFKNKKQKPGERFTKLPDYQQTIDLANQLKRLKQKALFWITYFTGSRITEVLSLRPEQFSTFKDEESTWMQISQIPVLKKRKEAQITRNVQIPICPETDVIADYVMQCSNEPQKKLFGMNRYTAYKIFTKLHWQKQKLFPHLLRHIRTSHLEQINQFDLLDLKEYYKWSNITQPVHYIMRDASKRRSKLLIESFQQKHNRGTSQKLPDDVLQELLAREAYYGTDNTRTS